jgi:hypothetical protein
MADRNDEPRVLSGSRNDQGTPSGSYYADGVLKSDDGDSDANDHEDPYAGLLIVTERHFWHKTHPLAPKWARRNWDSEIRRYKALRVTYRVLRALRQAKADDATDIHWTLKAPEPRTATREAWQTYHRQWVAAECARIAEEAQAPSREEPFSRYGIANSLPDAERQTWDAYRKLVTRPTGGTGQRNRSSSRQKRLLSIWEAQYPAEADTLRWMVGPKEDGAGYFAMLKGVPLPDVPGLVLEALRSWQAFKMDNTPLPIDLIRPEQLPRKNSRGPRAQKMRLKASAPVSD